MGTSMDADEIRGALAGRRFGDVRLVAETGSTNADVAALARGGAPEGVVLVADHQTHGRGRLDRTWQAPPGSSLLLSILSRPAAPDGPGLGLEQVHLLSTAVGVAAADAARSITGADILLKWPNDLVVTVDGSVRKVSGILAESVLDGDRVDAVVIGIGINVNWPVDLPADLADLAIALNALAGGPVDRSAVLVDLLDRFSAWYGALGTPDGPQLLLDRYRSLSATLGSQVRAELDGESVEGLAVDVTRDGHLVIGVHAGDRADGGEVTREIVAGDVVHLRPRSD
jgi:BirA family biotin operon repressor/biotin-[acetyl-CoA-carboxylase] ligase